MDYIGEFLCAGVAYLLLLVLLVALLVAPKPRRVAVRIALWVLSNLMAIAALLAWAYPAGAMAWGIESAAFWIVGLMAVTMALGWPLIVVVAKGKQGA